MSSQATTRIAWESGRQAQSCPSKPPSPSLPGYLPTQESTEYVAAPSIVTRLSTWHRAVTHLTVSVDNPHQIAEARYFHDSHLSAHSIRGGRPPSSAGRCVRVASFI